MRPSLFLGSSVRRKNCTSRNLLSSDSELDRENSDVNTPVRVLDANVKDGCCYSDSPHLNGFSSRPSISLATSVRRKVYYIDSSEESPTEDLDLSKLDKSHDTFSSEFLKGLHESPTQPCINYNGELEHIQNPLSNYSSIGNRRRNRILSSEEEDHTPVAVSRPSIRYQSSVRRKNNSRRILTIIESDSESEIGHNVESKRSSFCIGPELICESGTLELTPTRHSVWKSLDSDLETNYKDISSDSLQDLEWQTAVSSSGTEDEEPRGEEPTEHEFNVDNESEGHLGSLDTGASGKTPEKFGLFSEDEEASRTEIEESRDKKDSSPAPVPRPAKHAPRNSVSDKHAAFVRQRSSLARYWYQQFNGKVFKNRLPEEVPIKWTGRLQRTAAQTLFITHVDGSKRVVIKLSKYVLDSEFRLKKTLLHECCHVAQFLLDSCTKPPHGQVFLKWGKVATKVFPDLKVEIYHNYEIIYKYRYQCLRCLQMFGRQTKINDETKIVCSVCNGTVIFVGKGALNSGGKGLQEKSQTQKSSSNPYSEFVKEKFAEYKKDMKEGRTPSRRAPSIMKEIAKLWRQRDQIDLIQDFSNLSIKD
ncbi:SprT-like metallopeptidase [Cryptosporidium canis]|nr:SprT-like metallopeptidase [Cryptosporidium canis]